MNFSLQNNNHSSSLSSNSILHMLRPNTRSPLPRPLFRELALLLHRSIWPVLKSRLRSRITRPESKHREFRVLVESRRLILSSKSYFCEHKRDKLTRVLSPVHIVTHCLQLRTLMGPTLC